MQKSFEPGDMVHYPNRTMPCFEAPSFKATEWSLMRVVAVTGHRVYVNMAPSGDVGWFGDDTLEHYHKFTLD